jgi:hypothetical protein
LDNIALVDRGIEKVCKLIDEYYEDSLTSFVFTADHGMGDRGRGLLKRPESLMNSTFLKVLTVTAILTILAPL